MKSAQVGAACLALAAHGVRAKNPLAEVLALMDSLAAKIVKEGETEAAAYKEFFEWCDDASKNTQFNIQTATSAKGKLEAAISKAADDAEAAAGKIEELASSIASNDADLKAATQIRDKEAQDFAAGERELEETLSALSRAVSIIEREMAKNPSAFAQLDSGGLRNLVKTLDTIVDAVSISSADRKTLTSFVQAQQNADDDDDAPGAPAAATYKSHSTSIFDVLEDLKEKAEEQLSNLRKSETNAHHNYNMLKQSLEDQMAVDTKHMKDQKQSKAASEQDKAIAEGDLQKTVKDLVNGNEALQTVHSDCMTTASDHEATVRARDEELKVIAQAKSILQSTTSGATGQAYSLLQVEGTTQVGSQLRSRSDLANAEIVNIVRRLAQEHHSAALSQLASRISAVMRFEGAGAGGDPFSKVKGLIQDMIMKLEATAQNEASEKAYCDEQLAKTSAKKDELDDDISKLTSKIDIAAARSASLKGEVRDLQAELAALAKSQAEMDKIRADSHAAFSQAKADLEQGLDGVRRALGVLRDYYGGASAALLQDGGASDALMQQPAPPEMHSKAQGAGDSIVGILEVVESDFAKNLAAEETNEDSASSEYEQQTQENAVTKTLKEQDVKYKSQEFKGLDKHLAELSGDRDSANAELTAVLDYYGQIKERCIAKPETYETRQSKRQAEIQGLKQALAILENETAFTQRGKLGRRKAFRGNALQ